MTVRTYTKTILLLALVTLGLGGTLLHLRIHILPQIGENYSMLMPLVAGILSVVIVPLLFLFKKTLAYGYVLNGILAILGTVTMAHFSLVHLSAPISFGSLILNTTFGDILLLWGKFLVGKSLFDLEMVGYERSHEKKGITYRYPNMGWWAIHLVVISTVYSLGNLLWR